MLSRTKKSSQSATLGAFFHQILKRSGQSSNSTGLEERSLYSCRSSLISSSDRRNLKVPSQNRCENGWKERSCSSFALSSGEASTFTGPRPWTYPVFVTSRRKHLEMPPVLSTKVEWWRYFTPHIFRLSLAGSSSIGWRICHFPSSVSFHSPF